MAFHAKTVSRSGRVVVHVTDEEKHEFAVMVDSEAGYHEFVLAELRCARARARMLVKEIETIGVALKHRLITDDGAIAWLDEANALEFLDGREEEIQPAGATGGSGSGAGAAQESLPASGVDGENAPEHSGLPHGSDGSGEADA